MLYPLVKARFDYGPRLGPVRAFVVHMAEGGGTVGYLSRNPARGVSVHFVIEYSARIVQMLHLDRVSGSINPNALRSDNDAPFTGYNGELVRYGMTARRSVLGPTWDSNPNQAIITVEVEGYARHGPNRAQRVALVLLARDLLGKFPDMIGILGHRDFQNYKACPGRFIPWANMALPGASGRHGKLP